MINIQTFLYNYISSKEKINQISTKNINSSQIKLINQIEIPPVFVKEAVSTNVYLFLRLKKNDQDMIQDLISILNTNKVEICKYEGRAFQIYVEDVQIVESNPKETLYQIQIEILIGKEQE